VDFDVIIIGAGPAGTSTAISCRKAGLSVVILERAEFPRYQVGEALHPGVETLLSQLGVGETIAREGFLRYDGVWTRRPGGRRRFVPFGSDSRGPWRGFQVDRARLDEILLNKAKRSGASVLMGCSPKDVHRIKAGIQIDGEFGRLRSKVIVDATGSRRFIARKLNLDTLQCSPRILARYGYFERRSGSWDCPTFTAKRTGWEWLAQIDTDRGQWVSASWGGDFPSLPAEITPLPSVSAVRGADITWQILRSPAEPRFYAVGDAAAVIDPACSHGVLRALSSGIMAAACISASLFARIDAKVASFFYGRWLRRSFMTDASRLATIYGNYFANRMFVEIGRTSRYFETGPTPALAAIGAYKPQHSLEL
jgi:flavin-dependent dehydrogenase